jgi:hypothetical protein
MTAHAGGWLTGTETTVLLAVLAVATAATATLFLVGLAAYRRRGTPSYLLLTLALGLLVARSLVGFGTALELVPMPVHHLVEHGSDVAIAVLVLYALYRAGPAETPV